MPICQHPRVSGQKVVSRLISVDVFQINIQNLGCYFEFRKLSMAFRERSLLLELFSTKHFLWNPVHWMAAWPSCLMASTLGAVTIRMPSELRLDDTLSPSHPAGRVHFRLNCRITLELKLEASSWSLASEAVLPSMLRTLLITVT